MARTADEERDYFQRRSANHARLAENCPVDWQRALHLKFATLYAERADQVVVQDN